MSDYGAGTFGSGTFGGTETQAASGTFTTFQAPAAMNGTTIQVGVQAVKGNYTSPMQILTVTVKEWSSWILGPSGWTPRKPIVAVGAAPVPVTPVNIGPSPVTPSIIDALGATDVIDALGATDVIDGKAQ